MVVAVSYEQDILYCVEFRNCELPLFKTCASKSRNRMDCLHISMWRKFRCLNYLKNLKMELPKTVADIITENILSQPLLTGDS